MAKKKKEENVKKLNAVVNYDGEGELLSDISTDKPINKVIKTKTKTKTKAKTKTKKEEKIKTKKEEKIKKIVEKSEKDIFNDIKNSGVAYYLKYGETIIYDSEKNKNDILIFQKDSFILNNEKFSYDGLRIKFKNK